MIWLDITLHIGLADQVRNFMGGMRILGKLSLNIGSYPSKELLLSLVRHISTLDKPFFR